MGRGRTTDLQVTTPDGVWVITFEHEAEDPRYAWVVEREHGAGNSARRRCLADAFEWLTEEILRTCF